MLFSDIRPFVRFARYLTITDKTHFSPCIPYDARIFYTRRGSGIIEVMGQSLQMKQGSLLLINSKVSYHIITAKNTVTYSAFNFDYTQSCSDRQTPIAPAFNKYEPSKLTENITFDDKTQFNNYIYIPGIELIEKTAEKLIKEHSKKLIGYELKSSSLMTEMLVEILRHSEMPTTSQNATVQGVLDYIHKNYDVPLKNADIAEKFGFHPYYLSNLIKSSTGMPLHKYVQQIRLMHAAELLESSAFSISEIAEMCGFCDVYHFSKCFKSVMQISPSEYAKG